MGVWGALVGITLQWMVVSGAPSVRLAVVPESEDLRTAADLLTVALSTNEQVVLVERAEMDKVLLEQALAAGQGRNLVRLGELLRADGLLVLQRPEAEDRPELFATLIAVKPGVVLRQAPYDWPALEPGRWAELVARQMSDLFPKLAVLPKDALPVSILNLRSSVNSPEASALERELTRMLYDRLAREREVFVLERRRLQSLASEKELERMPEAAFWSGGYLLEGIINKEGFRTNVVTLSGRIVPPDKTNFTTVEVSGARTNLAGIINDLAIRILAVVKRNGAAAEWNPLAEAERYWEEAKWAFRWGMFKEAAAACEASWALGRQTKEVAELRIQAYRNRAGSPGQCSVNAEVRQVRFGNSFRPRSYDPTQAAAFVVTPDPERLNAMLRSLELYAEGLRAFVLPESRLDSTWFGLGTDLLDRGGWWLRYYYFTTETRAGHEDQLATLKRLSLEISAALAKHPSFRVVDTKHELLKVRARDTAFWADTPEQALASYREWLAAGDWPHARTRFLNVNGGERIFSRLREGYSVLGDHLPGDYADWASPGVAGWSWEDRRRCPAVWAEFVNELCNSTNVLVQLEGSYLRSSYAWTEEDYEVSFRQLLDFAWKHRETLMLANLDETLLSDFTKLVESRGADLSNARRQRLKDEDWAKFRRDFSALRKQRAQILAGLKALQERTLWLEARKNYLQTQGTYNTFYFDALMRESYQPEEAIQLLPLLLEFRDRLGIANATNNARFRLRDLQLARLEAHLRNAVAPPPPVTNAPVRAVAQPSSVRVPATNTAATPPSLAPRNVLEVTRFWRIPSTYHDPGLELMPQMVNCCYRDGRLWVDVRHEEPRLAHCDFMGVDLDTLQTEILPFEPGVSRMSPYDREPRLFEIYDGNIYLGLPDMVMRGNLKRRTWERFSLPEESGVRPARLKDRLFFTTDTSILEYLPSGEFRVLASVRRRPAATVLDGFDHFGIPPLFLAPTAELRACLRGVIYGLPPNASDWRQVTTMPYRFTPYVFDEGVVGVAGSVLPYVCTEVWGLRGNAATFELLFRHDPAPGFNSMLPHRTYTNTPVWRLREAFHSMNHVVSLDDECVWFFVGPIEFKADAGQRLRFQENDGRHACLRRFAPGEDEPLEIPLRFTCDTASWPQDSRNALLGPMNRQLIFESTPKGFVISRRYVPGFWLIPKADLDAAVQTHAARKRADQAAAQASQEAQRKEVLQALDKNHDGVLAPAEKTAAIKDTRYLELELSKIDTNGNGFLDIDELAFFDANKNGQLELAEYAAIENTFTNLATKILGNLDRNNDGRLGTDEITPALAQALPEARTASSAATPLMRGPGDTRDNRLDQAALAGAMQRRLMRELRAQVGSGVRPTASQSEMAIGFRDLFQVRVEEIWKRAKAAPRGNSPQPNALTGSLKAKS